MQQSEFGHEHCFRPWYLQLQEAHEQSLNLDHYNEKKVCKNENVMRKKRDKQSSEIVNNLTHALTTNNEQQLQCGFLLLGFLHIDCLQFSSKPID